MKVIQAVGPFYPNIPVPFNVPNSGVRYIKFGIQVPQAPWLLAPLNSENSLDYSAHMVGFEINGDASGDSSGTSTFLINGNGILEFEDFYRSSVFYIKPLQYMDAYTIIDIAFIEEEESA